LRLRAVAGLTAVAAVLAGCGTSAIPTVLSTVGSNGPTEGPSVTPTASTRGTPTPSSTQIPGFEAWSIVSPASVEISVDGSTLVMHLTKRALWFQASRGVLFWMSVDGDFRVSATVRTARFSDPSRAPGGDGTVQLAGLMARAQSISEDYVHIVVGSDADGLSVETKSTTNANSIFDGPAWPTGSAELRICRIGTTFSLEKRPVGATTWTLAATIERPDLAGSIEVGPNIYSDSPPDLVARYDGLRIEAIAPGGSC